MFFLILYLLLGSCFAQNIPGKNSPNKNNIDFSGKWTYSEDIEYDGKTYTVEQELYFAQRENHVCGCWKKWGAPTGREEFYALEGNAKGMLLDILADKGSFENNTDGSYQATYPFEPINVMRLKRVSKGLVRAGIDNAEFVIKNGFPKDLDVAYSEINFFTRESDFSPSMCQEPAIDWQMFYQKCKNQVK
jgi:hypothetical protein